MRTLIPGLAVSAMAVFLFAAPATAQPYDYPATEEEEVYGKAGRHGGESDYQAGDVYEDDSYGEEHSRYRPEGPDEEPGGHRDDEGYQEGETWRDGEGRLRCRRSDGTTGLIVGGGAGALVGRGIDTRGERGTGTIIGAIAGALVGREVERGSRCR